jgi:hypothetical protein
VSRWTPEYELDYQWKLWNLANYVKAHRYPKAFADRLRKRHGDEFLEQLRARLRAGPPEEPRRALA